MGHIRFLRFVGIRVVVRLQCKSAEYYFHRRPSFPVESSIIYATTFHIIFKECICEGHRNFFQIIHFCDSSSKLGCTFLKFAIKKLPPFTELLQTCLPCRCYFFFKKGNTLKNGVGQIRACLHGAHSCMSFQFVMYSDYFCTACILVPTALRKQNGLYREKRFMQHNCQLGIQ